MALRNTSTGILEISSCIRSANPSVKYAWHCTKCKQHQGKKLCYIVSSTFPHTYSTHNFTPALQFSPLYYSRKLFPWSLVFTPSLQFNSIHHFISCRGWQNCEWMTQSQWKLGQLWLKTWGISTCVRYFHSLRHFELTSIRHGVCQRLDDCDGWRSDILHQDWNFMWQKHYRN